MPKFTQIPIDQKPEEDEIDQKVINQYKKFIENLSNGHKGLLEFSKNEQQEMGVAKTALDLAGKEINKFVKVRKKRGKDLPALYLH